FSVSAACSAPPQATNTDPNTNGKINTLANELPVNARRDFINLFLLILIFFILSVQCVGGRG
ncbi:MAG: hypothetical protein ACI9UU_002595, partial [Candidatus Azotimanducaceae bacterium]